MGGALLVLWTIATQAASAWEIYGIDRGLPSENVRSITVASDGAVWMGLQGDGLVRLLDGNIELVTESDGLTSNGVADLVQDSEGRIWAPGLGGYSVREEGRWTGHTEFAGIRPRVVFSVHEDRESGAIWLAANGGAARLDERGWTAVVQADGLPHQVVHAVLVDRAGVRWFACRAGLARQRDGTIDVFFPDTNFRSVVEGQDGVIWFGTSRGVLKWDAGSWEWQLEGRTVLPSLLASDGSIWATAEGEGLFRYREGHWLRVPLPEQLGEDVAVYDVAEAGDGALWVATSRGALRGVF